MIDLSGLEGLIWSLFNSLVQQCILKVSLRAIILPPYLNKQLKAQSSDVNHITKDNEACFQLHYTLYRSIKLGNVLHFLHLIMALNFVVMPLHVQPSKVFTIRQK